MFWEHTEDFFAIGFGFLMKILHRRGLSMLIASHDDWPISLLGLWISCQQSLKCALVVDFKII